MLSINNDLAKKIIKRTENVVFTQRMDSHWGKLSYEYQALAIIKLVFGTKSDGFAKLESPDLQNVKTGLGIEVVTSHPESFHRAENLERKLSDEIKNGNIKAVEKIRKQIEEEGFKVSGANHVLYPAHYAIETNTFYNTIIAKSQKIGGYKAGGFNKIGLFVWHLSPVATDFVNDLPNEWSNILKEGDSNIDQKYDFTIVIVEHTLLFFNKKYDCEHIIEIPYNVFFRLPTLGRMAAEGLITDSDPIWG